MKIAKIEISNLKTVSSQKVSLEGSSIIASAGNRAGKSTVLKTLIDRFRGEAPDKILKEGEEKGFYYMELTDGAKIEWKFTQKTESFAYITADGIKMTKGVLSGIGKKYFGIKFDIDSFIHSSPSEQMRLLANLVGLDFDDINNRYKEAFAERTDANREFKRVAGNKKEAPIEVVKPDMASLSKEEAEIIEKNDIIKEDWRLRNKAHMESIYNFNNYQLIVKTERERIEDSFLLLCKHKGGQWSDCIDFEKAESIKGSCEKEKPRKTVESLPDPELISLEDINKRVTIANAQERAYDNYIIDKENYEAWVQEGLISRKIAEACDEKVKSIELEKKEMIESSKIPKGFEFSDGGLIYNGFKLSDSSVSSSEKYIAGMKLGLMSLGSLEAMHFDASFLDRNSLNEVQLFAESNNIQLLIERPDFDGDKTIKYEILSK